MADEPKYPCEPTPFYGAVMGGIMICKKCGHGYDKPADCKVKGKL